MEINELFKSFDHSNKGFLTYREYEALCYSMCKQPKPQRTIGDRIYLKDITDITTTEDDYRPIFKFLSKNTDTIDFEKLKDATQNLQFTEQELRDMVNFFGENGIITYDDFLRIFSD